jgi:hypothetical protein
MKRISILTLAVLLSIKLFAQWTPTSINTGNVRCLATDGVKIYAGTSNNGILVSNDNGLTWNPSNTGLSNHDIWTLHYSENKLYAGTVNGIFLSNDYGNSWTEVSNNLSSPYKHVLSIEVVDTFIFIGTGSGYGSIFRANTNDYIWSFKQSGAPYIETILHYSGQLLASREVQGIITSYNLGDNWIACNNGLSGAHILRDLTVKDTLIYAAINYKGLYKYYPTLDLWEPAGLQDVLYLGSVASCNSFILAGSGAENKGVFISYDLGNNWDTINDGLINKNITTLLIGDNCIFAGISGNGLWKRDIITSSKQNQKDHFAINIFPNPTNDFLNISIDKEASLDIINIQGQIIETMNLSDKTNMIEINFLKNGIYFLKITSSENEVFIKKLIKQ